MYNKKILILPNYGQSDNIWVLVIDENGSRVESYSDVVTKLGMPKSFSRGLPASFNQLYPQPSFVLGQLLSINDGSQVFSKTCRAGLDRTERQVFLTGIFFDTNPETADYSVDDESCLNHIRNSTNYELSDTQANELKNAIITCNNPDKVSAGQIKMMWTHSHREKSFNHYTSVPLNGSAFVPDSHLEKKTIPHTEKAMAAALVVTLILGALAVNHHVRTNRLNDDISKPARSDK